MSVYDVVHPFNGRFGGCTYDSSFPVSPFAKFISKTIMDRVAVGAIGVFGKVGECDPPSIVMPPTVEPSKSRLVSGPALLELLDAGYAVPP